MPIVGALPFPLTDGTTAVGAQVLADLNAIKNDVNTNAAHNGANSDITSLTALSTPLTAAQGGAAPLTSGTVTAAATLDLVLTGYTGYRGLVIVLGGCHPATDNTNLIMQVSSNGGVTYDAGAGNYDWGSQILFGGFNTVLGSTGDTSLVISSSQGNDTSEAGDFSVRLLFQTSTTFRPKAYWDGTYTTVDGSSIVVAGGGSRLAAQDTDAIRFKYSSGNIAGTRYAVYGLL